MRKKLFVGYLHDRIFGDHYEIKFPDKMENAEDDEEKQSKCGSRAVRSAANAPTAKPLP